MNEVGVDLAGVPTKQTGFALLMNMTAKTKVVFTDDEIIGEIAAINPPIVSIDAPLSLPLHGKMRACEKQLVRMGIRVFPCMFAGMKKLTERGIQLAQRLERNGYKVIESYPGSAQDILGIPRKGRNKKLLQNALVNYGITGDVTNPDITDHELDAITSAIVGKLYLVGNTLSIGDKNEGLMVIPKRTYTF